MFALIRTARYTTQALRCAAGSDPPSARMWVAKIAEIRPLRPFEKAFLSGLLLMEHDFGEAEKGFREVAAETAGRASASANDAYTLHYAKARLAALHGNDDLMRQFEARAAEIRCD